MHMDLFEAVRQTKWI